MNKIAFLKVSAMKALINLPKKTQDSFFDTLASLNLDEAAQHKVSFKDKNAAGELLNAGLIEKLVRGKYALPKEILFVTDDQEVASNALTASGDDAWIKLRLH